MQTINNAFKDKKTSEIPTNRLVNYFILHYIYW